jgi:hypothetical protein
MRYLGRVGFFKLMAETGMPYVKNDDISEIYVLRYSITRSEFQEVACHFVLPAEQTEVPIRIMRRESTPEIHLLH